jgi:hypothetical protein
MLPDSLGLASGGFMFSAEGMPLFSERQERSFLFPAGFSAEIECPHRLGPSDFCELENGSKPLCGSDSSFWHK